MDENIIRGAIGVDDRNADFYDPDIRKTIKKIRFRKAPFVAMVEGVSKESTATEEFTWPVQPIGKGRGLVADVYTDAGMQNAYVSGGVVGTPLYLSMDPKWARQIIGTDVITVWDPATAAMRRIYISNVSFISDATALAHGILRQVDTANALAASNLQFTITGNAQPEYAPLPAALYADPNYFKNLVQTFAEAGELSNREIKQREKHDPNIRVRNKLQALGRLKQKKQLSYLLGARDVFPGPPGTKKVTLTRGFKTFLEEYQTGENTRIFNFKTDTLVDGRQVVTPGATFDQCGLKWIRAIGELISRTGEAPTKTVVTSGLVILLINEAIEANSDYKIEAKESVYGINVSRFIVPGGQDWMLVEDPMFSDNPMLQMAMAVYEKQLVKERPFERLKFIPDTDNEAGGKNYRSGIKEGWEETTGLQAENLDACAWLTLAPVNTAS